LDFAAQRGAAVHRPGCHASSEELVFCACGYTQAYLHKVSHMKFPQYKPDQKMRDRNDPDLWVLK
jgi:hypothetical protein